MSKKTSKKQLLFRLNPACAALLLAFAAQTAQANPIGAAVVNGQASFATTGNTLTVTNTPGAIINWQGFSIGANEITRFAQQSASSAVLNRVISNNPSSILGSLQSNGRVFLVNPNGIVFGQGATVNVAGMVASTLNLSNADFIAGRYNFTDVSGAQNISNAGNITAQSGGQIYLIAANVENTGIINAPNGEILLAAGHSVELVNSNEPNLRVNITAPAGDATNVGKLVAEAGSLGLFGTMVRSSGTVSANSAMLQGGKIVFKATQRAEISGAVTANGATGGTIQALGNQVGIMDGATVTASGAQGGGTVLVGGDYQGKNPDVPNAQVTYVAPTAIISADAAQNGNGGKVIVWADDTTRAYGNISVRGGANSGNGGFVETSGHNYLDFRGVVDTRASQGKAGTLLLDPADITIDNSADFLNGGTFSAGWFYGATGNSTLTWNTINLQSGSLEIRTNSAGAGSISGNGDIFVNATGTVTGPTTLTLLANGAINIANGVSVSGSGDFNLIAGWNNTGWAVSPSPGGNITFGAGSSLSTSGNIWFNAGNAVIQDPTATITANTLTLGNTNGFSIPNGISLSGTNMVNTLAAIITNGTGGLAFLNGKPLTIGTGAFSINGVDASVNPNPINIATTAGGITISQNISSGGTVTLNSGAGAITSSGTGQIVANTIALQTTGGSGNIGTSTAAPLKTSSIGGAGNANISIGGLDFVSGPGAVYLKHIGDATLQSVTTTGMGIPVDISASNNLTATSISTGAADLNLAAGNLLSIPALANLSGANISLGGDLINIIAVGNPASINAGTGVTWLHPSTSGRSIDLGAKAGLPNTLELSTSELDVLTGTGTLRIGAITAGNISFSAPVAPANFTGTLSLESGGTVTQATVADIITANKLAIKAKGNVALDIAPNVVGALAGSITGTGTEYFHFNNSGNLSIDTVDGVAGISIANFPNYTPGSASGVIALQSAGNITQTATGGLGGAAVWASSSVGLVDLTTAGNPTGILSGSAYMDFSYKSSNTIALMNVAGHSGISSLMAGNIAVAGPGFTNSLVTPFSTLGRWLVYAASPASVTKGGLTSTFRQYNTAYGGNVPPNGNGFIYASAPGTLFVHTTLSSGAASNVYGTAPTAMFGYAIAKTATADNEDMALIAGTPAFTPTLSSTTPAGSYTVYYAGGLSSVAGYAFAAGAGVAYTVNPKLLTLITASLTGSASKTYDGTTNATLAPGNFLLSGFVNTDSAAVTKTSGAYASQNVGSNILVSTTLTPSDFSPVGSTILSNYILPTSASGLIGSITVRPLSTWSGLGGNSLWSNPANWDVLPDGNNVLAVAIPTGGSVTFDGAVAMQALSSAGNMVLNGNNLSIGSFIQTGGSLTGTGSLNVGNSFSQTGGTIALTGTANANITQATGNLNIANLSAPAANFSASTGAITQTGPIVAASLTTHSATGTTLNAGNQIGSFSASNSSSGNIVLANTASPLTIVGINNSGGNILVDNTGATITDYNKVSASGAVDIKAHSPITIGSGGIAAGGNITLTAGVAGSPAAADIITLNGAISGGSIVLAAHSVTGAVPAPAGATLQIYIEPVAAIPAVIDTLVNNIVVMPPSVPFSPPTPPALAQTPAANTSTTDEKKKDAQAADVVVLAAEPAPAAAPMPVCK